MTWHDTISEKDAIRFHLNGGRTILLPDGRSLVVTSGFYACLSDTRNITGRDSNGKVVDHKKEANWLGNIGYIILLDQIGSCFINEEKNIRETDAIPNALENFSSLGEKEIAAICALRNALAHDYSLINKNSKHPDRQHSFALSRNEPKMIRLPLTPWNGDILNRNANNQTTVDIVKLADLVENIYSLINDLAANDKLKLILSGGKNELLIRYMFAYQPL